MLLPLFGVMVAIVDEDGESEDGGLGENFEMCVGVCVCVYDYISILNYQYFLIVFTTLLMIPTVTTSSDSPRLNCPLRTTAKTATTLPNDSNNSHHHHTCQRKRRR